MTQPATPKRKRALDCALTLLGRRPYSRQALRLALEKRAYQPVEIGEALDRLEEWGYLDDRYYAITRIQKYIEEKRGRLFIKNKLQQAGVLPEIINAELDRLYPQAKEREVLRQLWAGFYAHHLTTKGRPTSKVLLKWSRRLLAAGFSEEEVKVCFEQEADS
ncbi:MAG TPA: regulatory protein RecX [Firmicutes bacterium]|nr:regulatory protein RecX [Bacillota bacterium]